MGMSPSIVNFLVLMFFLAAMIIRRVCSRFDCSTREPQSLIDQITYGMFLIENMFISFRSWFLSLSFLLAYIL